MAVRDRRSCSHFGFGIKPRQHLSAFQEIRQLYLPVQPAVSSIGTAVTYQEFLPHESLRDYIYCYWQLRTKEKLSEQFTYRVVADGCVDIFFELDNPLENFVMGFCRKYTEFPLANEFNYIGIRFLPTMFPRMFGVNASELSNRFESLSLVAPETAAFIAGQLDSSCGMTDVTGKLDTHLLGILMRTTQEHDNRLYEAISIILRQSGVPDAVNGFDTGISPRQLQRLFNYYIGDTPKTFSRVVRFQHILRAKPSTQSLRKNKLFFDHGYYDQAHFIKEFKNFYGVTPSTAFGR
ncbi:MAG: AraC family transcriptional regulator [Chitinophagaceae bacterium]|nr:MAG: AraC family transcriptional regulator [Chitinophagaceae bacterium]